MKMKRHIKNVPVKSRQKLFSMNISNFFMLNMINCHYTNGATKVVQKRELRKFLSAKIPNGAKKNPLHPVGTEFIPD